MLSSLDHIVIAVRDLDAATETYAALYGRSPSWRGTHPSWGTANTLFRLANTYIELLAPAGDGKHAEVLRTQLAGRGDGPYALAFGCADADAAASALRGAGLAAGDPVAAAGRQGGSVVERLWRSISLPLSDTRDVPMLVIEHRSPAAVLPPAAAGNAGATIDGVDHVVIMTGDADGAIALYRDRLGLRLAFDRTFDARGLRLLFFRIGGITVEVAAPLAAGAGAAGDADRFWGISYRVADIDAVRARTLAAGFDVSAVRDGHKPGTRVCTVRAETHGVATLLLQPAGSPAER